MDDKTDRELLEAAARAAGELPLLSHGKWNPLTDDGDALRLSIDKDWTVMHHDRKVFITSLGLCWSSLPHGNDPYAATRRAIVQATAELQFEVERRAAASLAPQGVEDAR